MLLWRVGVSLHPELEEALLVNAENFAVKVEGYATSIRKFDARRGSRCGD